MIYPARNVHILKEKQIHATNSESTSGQLFFHKKQSYSKIAKLYKRRFWKGNAFC